jgi:hypothetical protein
VATPELVDLVVVDAFAGASLEADLLSPVVAAYAVLVSISLFGALGGAVPVMGLCCIACCCYLFKLFYSSSFFC